MGCEALREAAGICWGTLDPRNPESCGQLASCPSASGPGVLSGRHGPAWG